MTSAAVTQSSFSWIADYIIRMLVLDTMWIVISHNPYYHLRLISCVYMEICFVWRKEKTNK